VKSMRILYHMARADFMERARQYSFLAMLGLVVWLGYAAATGIITLSVPPDLVGEINSAWVGALMTMTVGLFLGWFGFYLVKGSVARDYETGVGQILATTPLSRPLYTLGKWLSNFAVLGIMVLILMVAGVLMILLIGHAPLDLWALISPLLLLGLPLVALVAAAAVVFDTVAWLRGSLGNIVFFFLFVLLMPATLYLPYSPLLDLTGMRLIGDGIGQAALGSTTTETVFSFGLGRTFTNPHTFSYDGVEWTAGLLIWRLMLIVFAVGLALLAAALFDRFNPTKESRARKLQAETVPIEAQTLDSIAPSEVHLTPLAGKLGFQFGGLYLAEVKLLVKGHRWWWYVVVLGLIVAELVVPLKNAPALLAIAWLWLIAPLNELGNRESVYRTREMIYSAPRPVLNQLIPLYLASISIVAVSGSGAFARYAWLGMTHQLLAWVSGLLFIPALAVVLGTLTNSRKLFEVVYVVWMYLIVNKAQRLDFVGIVPETPWLAYVLLALVLFAVTPLIRYWRLTGWRPRFRTMS